MAGDTGAGDQVNNGHRNIAIGENALTGGALGGGDVSDSTTRRLDYNIAIGSNTLNSTGQNASEGQIAIGYNALTALTTGTEALAIGYNAGASLTTGNQNLAIGYNAMKEHVDGGSNIAIGTGAMDGTRGGSGGTQNNSDGSNYNLFIGRDAGGGNWADVASNENVAIGHFCMYAILNGASSNTAVGYSAAAEITSGDENTCIGKTAGDAITSGDKNTCIGYASDASATADNQIAIGNATVTDGANKGRWGNASIGTNNIQTDWTVDSDSRIKKDIEDSDIGLSFINDLKTRKYKKRHPSEYDAEILEARYKQGGSNYDDDKDEIIKDEFDDDKVWNGLVAQEVKTVMDDLDVEFSGWSEDTKGKQGIQYSTLVVPLIKAVQELSAKVEALEAK